MKRTILLFTPLLFLAMAAGVHAQDKNAQEQKSERYTATAIGLPTRGARTAFLNITIQEYSTDEEVKHLVEVLRTGGSDALQIEMSKMNKGWAAPVATTSHRLSFARTRPTENGRRILLAAERPMTFFELRRATRSRDHTYGIIRLDLDEEGKGEGTLIMAAKVRFNKEGQLEVEQYGMDPIRLVNVKRVE